jgi:hypothetical protein
MSQTPVFSTAGEMFNALFSRRIEKGATVACAHCPWMGEMTMFPPHLLMCPDQSLTHRQK